MIAGFVCACAVAGSVLGADAPGWLTARGVTAWLVGADGEVVTTGGWPADERRRTA